MRCLILGAGGFIGRNLVEMAFDRSYDEFILFDKDKISFCQEMPAKQQTKCRVIQGDFNTETDFMQLTQNIDIVYHLISTTLPNNSNQHIAQGLIDNVVVTSLLLEACVKNGVKKVIFLSSGGTIYGMSDNVPLSEDAVNNPISGYGLQKITIEKLLYLYWYLYGLDYRIIRLSNPYGKHQRPNGVQGVVTTFIYRAMRNETLSVYGDGSVIRDYIYIEDAVTAILNIVDYEGNFKVFNVGSGKGYSVNEVIGIIEKVLGKRVAVEYQENRKADVPVNILDISRYESCFGQPDRLTLEAGVTRTVQYFDRCFKEL
ncbi:MAG: NAD-dependent epimerase/dehydratase family protein [Clostridium sp.]|nr:NAD-dependent epimerase/dehydratase family protein [Clostridium sp.]